MYPGSYNKSIEKQLVFPFGRKIFPNGAINSDKTIKEVLRMDKKNLPHDHGCRNEEQIMEYMPGEEEIAGVSEAMKQLGDPSRLRIFWILCHCEECVLNIAAIVNMTSPAVSHHLRLLKSSGLIVSRREGKEMYYRTADTELAQVLHHTIEKLGRITCPESRDQSSRAGHSM